MYVGRICPDFILSITKWQSISVCLVLAYRTGLDAKAIAEKIFTGLGTYTTTCFFDCYEIKLSPIKILDPVIDLLDVGLSYEKYKENVRTDCKSNIWPADVDVLVVVVVEGLVSGEVEVGEMTVGEGTGWGKKIEVGEEGVKVSVDVLVVWSGGVSNKVSKGLLLCKIGDGSLLM
ncbi:hypothetical protein Tco_1090130, partial [Tanacetum coccineum]